MAAPRRRDVDARAEEIARRYKDDRVPMRVLADELGCSVGAVRARIVGKSVRIRGRSEIRASRDTDGSA